MIFDELVNDLTPKAYAKIYLQKAQTYIEDVLTEKYLAGRYEKLAVERYIDLLSNPLYYYDERAVSRVLKFFALLKVDNRGTVKQFHLANWQIFFIMSCYGFYLTQTRNESNPTRLVKQAFFTSAKKQGKSSFLAALSLYECAFDNELNANILYVSTSTQNARVVLDYAKKILQLSHPALQEIYHTYRNEIFTQDKAVRNKIEIRSSDSTMVQGLNSSLAIVDEIFYHESLELKNNIISGMRARHNPLCLVIGTVSNKSSHTFEYYEHACNVLDKIIQDDTFFVYIFQQDNMFEKDEPKLWHKSCPSLGLTVQLDEAILSKQAAESSAITLQNFLTDYLNYWGETDTVSVFLEDDVIKQAMTHFSILPQSEIFIGLDLSSINDLSAISVLSYNENLDVFSAKVFNIFPNNEKTMIKKGSINLSNWWLPENEFENDYTNHKYVIRCQTKTLDEEKIVQIIAMLAQRYKIRAVGYDPFNANYIIKRLENELKLYCEPVKQNYELSYPIKQVERYFLEERFFLEPSPCTRWQFKNVRIKTDRNNNYSINKLRQESVDAVVAISVAMSLALQWHKSTFIKNI